MPSQADPASRPSGTPAFPAAYARHVDELRRRAIALCTGHWDVNEAHLLMRDSQSLIAHIHRTDPAADLQALMAFAQALSDAVFQTNPASAEQREEVLARLGALYAGRGSATPARNPIRYQENDRIEVPPAGFWRRWTADAPPPTYSRPGATEVRTPNLQDELDLSRLDIDAMIASERVDSSLEIVHERIAADRIHSDPSDPASAPDDFIQAPMAAMRAAQDDFDWENNTVASPPARLKARSSETETEPTATPRTARRTGAAEKPGSTPAKSAAEKPAIAAKPAAPTAPLPGKAASKSTRSPASRARTASSPAPEPKANPQAATPAPPAATPTQPVAPPPAASAADTGPASFGAGRRVYHLTQSSALACALDQRLEQLGYELELFDTVDDLKEVLGALTPNIVIIDAEFETALEAIGRVLQTARARASEPVWMLALCAQDSMPVRLAAHRAGVDALLPNPSHPMPIIARIEHLLQTGSSAGYRILIVEDDESQGLFAESVLRNAGMETRVVTDGLKVMQALDDFQPDLVLMDLYMPDCNGDELTALIREHPEFVHLPIVFLSGETDQDKHLEALSAGADDFLSKPIRPRHLIATITNRIQRARSLRTPAPSVIPTPQPMPAAPAPATTPPAPATPDTAAKATKPARPAAAMAKSPPPRPAEPRKATAPLQAAQASQASQATEAMAPPTTGPRWISAAVMQQHLHQSLAQAEPAQRRGGVLLISFADAANPAEQAARDQCLQALVAPLESGLLATRHGNGGILIFDPKAGPGRLAAHATALRKAITAQQATLDPQDPARISLGASDLRRNFADVQALLDTLERAALKSATPPPARLSPQPSGEAGLDADTAPIDALLEDAVQAGRLGLDFQPITTLQGGGHPQYQALLRLRAPDGSIHPAAQILPRAQAAGRLPELDQWALLRALEVIGEHLAVGKRVTLFISQSVQTLTQPGHGDWISAHLQGQAALGESLVLELDAEQIGADLDKVQAVCAQLLPQGMRFCLSRYRGSPEQSGLLRALPLDLVKVAPELLSQLNNHKARANFSELVEQLHARGTGVIAPRVEDARTAATLWMSGIDYIQGNLVQTAGRALDYDFNAAVL